MKTVLIVMPMGGMLGGSERALWNLIQHGAKSDLRWHLVFFEEGELVENCRRAGCGVTVLSAGRVREVHKLAATVSKIAQIARREKVDLIFGWLGMGHNYGGPAARLAGIPAGWIQHDVPREPDTLERLTARIPARVIVTVCQAGHDFQKKLCPQTDIKIVHPGVELDRFDPATLPTPAQAREQLGLPSDRPLVGIVGRLQHWKGMHTFIGALPQVRESHPDVLGVIVGGQHSQEPDYEGKLRTQIRDLSLSDTVRLVGYQRDIPLWMQALDIVVHASRREPFGIVVIEAMALAKPLIATDEGGPTEIVTPEKDGLLTPFDDTTALARALLRYLDNPTWARQIGAAARERALTFSTELYAQKLIRIFEDVIAGGASLPR